MCKQAYRLGREMIWEPRPPTATWSRSSRRRLGRQDQPFKPLAVRTLAEQQAELPDWRLDHLPRMTDSTGMLQHATLHHPQFRRGLLHRRQRPRPAADRAAGGTRARTRREVQRLATTYAAFLQAAFDPETKRFRNFLGFDRRWLEEVGSEDSHGRALWALGTCVGRSRRPDLPAWAAALLRAGPAGASWRRPRPATWAFGLLGIREYLRRLRRRPPRRPRSATR